MLHSAGPGSKGRRSCTGRIWKMRTPNERNVYLRTLLAACLLALLTLVGCSVNVKNGENGENKKVEIETPIGGIHVDNNANARDTGLPVYPGARLKEKE